MMASASEKEVVSGAVGPEAMKSMGSPITSDMINEITRAGAAHLASCPPLMSERCFRTALNSRIVAEPSCACRLAVRPED